METLTPFDHQRLAVEIATEVLAKQIGESSVLAVAGATGNIVYEVGVLQMRDEVATGQRLQQAMENTDLFPNMVIQMIAVGEESGSLDDMSAKVADFYEEDVDNAVDNLSSLLEPMIMAILGGIIFAASGWVIWKEFEYLGLEGVW